VSYETKVSDMLRKPPGMRFFWFLHMCRMPK